MRTIDSHQIPGNPVNDGIEIKTIDAPGPGGANHIYQITPLNGTRCTLNFQHGGVPENGVNGVTQEALLAVVIDRLRSFQAGPFPSHHNEVALSLCDRALIVLHQRTLDRMARGVEGKLTV